MIDRTLVMVTGLIAQAACAVLVALMLQAFHRLYRRRYLAHWARSWWAFSVYLLGGALGFFLYSRLPSTSPLRVSVAILSLIGGYLQIGLAALRHLRGDDRPRGLAQAGLPLDRRAGPARGRLRGAVGALRPGGPPADAGRRADLPLRPGVPDRGRQPAPDRAAATGLRTPAARRGLPALRDRAAPLLGHRREPRGCWTASWPTPRCWSSSTCSCRPRWAWGW